VFTLIYEFAYVTATRGAKFGTSTSIVLVGLVCYGLVLNRMISYVAATMPHVAGIIRDVGIDIIRQLVPGKKTYIGQLQALAAAAVVHSLPEEWLRGRDGYMWIDNMGAKYNLQKGSARKEDSARIVDSFAKRVAISPPSHYISSVITVMNAP